MSRLFTKIFIFLISLQCYSQMNVSVNETNLFDPIDTPIYAGENISTEIESDSNAYLITVNILPNNTNNTLYNSWHIDVQKSEIIWDSNLDLQIRLTGTGSSIYGNTASGQTSYGSIQNSNTTIVNGTGWIDNIPLQVKITGISVTLEAKNYSTDIIFTLIDD